METCETTTRAAADMLKETGSIYTDNIKFEAASRFGFDRKRLKPLEGFENFIYICEIRGEPRILRITHSLHRPQEHIQGEISWVNSMAESGIPVAPALPSLKGRLVEIIPDENSGTYFTAVSFQFAPGVMLDDHPEEKKRYWNESLFEEWGQVLAQIHNHAQFQAQNLDIQRPQWHEYDVLDLEQFIPADQTRVMEVARSHLEELHALPLSPQVYGLIHADLTQWNFNVDEGGITVYDFDSSEYGWFIKDLAVSLYYAGVSYEGDNRDSFNQSFLKHLVKGYRRLRSLPTSWLERIPDFLFLQRIILYAYCYQLGYPDHLTEEDIAFLEKTRKIIESGEEPTRLDYSSL